MSAPGPDRSSAPFPKYLILSGMVAIILMLAVSTFLTWRVSRQIQIIVHSQIEVLTAAERIEHYGSVLELTIKSVVATGDAEAAARYRTVQPRLRQIITALRNELKLDPNRIAAAEIDRADLQLVALEHQALELAARGRLAEARAIIHSERYDDLVRIYFDGVRTIEHQAGRHLDHLRNELRTYLSALLVLGLVSFGFLLVAWLALARRARNWAAELEQERERAAQAVAELARSQAQLEQANARLLEQVRIDPLTRLQSRRKLNEDLPQFLSRASERGESYSLVMCDVDHFKQYNDSYGHQAGDEVLRAVADAFSNVSRSRDRIYRYGGEEFVLILRTASLEAGTVCAERYRAAVEALRIPHHASASGCVTVTMGVAQLEPGRAQSAERWIERADGAMYEAKRRGRNQVGSGKLAAA